MRCINCNSEALMTVEPIHVPEIIATLHIYHCIQCNKDFIVMVFQDGNEKWYEKAKI
jgi:hypothetical protein